MLHELGIRIVLSDVHGECDVNDIVEHAFDEVRLSPRLVREATVSHERRRVLEGTVALAHALELPVIAVGIETEPERATMRRSGLRLRAGLSVRPAHSRRQRRVARYAATRRTRALRAAQCGSTTTR